MTMLVETIVKPLVDHPGDVKVTQELCNGEIKYRLTVHPEDVGKVIGKQGKVAKAIRMLLYSVGHHNDENVTLEIQ
ncbi:KH domain-containing protein [Bacillus mycoides]|uniref:KH domain-containing protein n=1 Tax=Bacillus mycoides TaxID=1405 RepID=UPI00099205CA|nr:KH domain-containing protein [Bacillus mycoides]OOR20843.1 RNA-binding protein [Bacillus mycoides]